MTEDNKKETEIVKKRKPRKKYNKKPVIKKEELPVVEVCEDKSYELDKCLSHGLILEVEKTIQDCPCNEECLEFSTFECRKDEFEKLSLFKRFLKIFN